LVVWHSLLPHGPAPNAGTRPRISAYVSMVPEDAAPFLGPTRHPDAPLSMSDAGTLAYLPSLLMASRGEEVAFEAQAKESREGGSKRDDSFLIRDDSFLIREGGSKRDEKDAGAVEEESCGDRGGTQGGGSTAAGGSDGHLERHPERQPERVSSASDPLLGGLPQVATARVRRQSRERRVERWRLRLPLLDEDPREAELPHPPPGEASGEPAVLTPLGQRLVGLVPWG
jgi:hypothetical protein